MTFGFRIVSPASLVITILRISHTILLLPDRSAAPCLLPCHDPTVNHMATVAHDMFWGLVYLSSSPDSFPHSKLTHMVCQHLFGSWRCFCRWIPSWTMRSKPGGIRTTPELAVFWWGAFGGQFQPQESSCNVKANYFGLRGFLCAAASLLGQWSIMN